MLSMGMHYPQDVRGLGRGVNSHPDQHPPQAVLDLPRGLTLCEIRSLNTAEGNPNYKPPLQEEALLKTEVVVKPEVKAKQTQEVPSYPPVRSSRSSPRRSSLQSRSEEHFRRRELPAVTNGIIRSNSFRCAGTGSVNLQHVPTPPLSRHERRAGSRQSMALSDGSIRQHQTSGCCGCQQNRISDGTGRQGSAGTAGHREGQDIQEILSVDQKRLHLRRGISREREEPGRPLPENADDPYYPSNYSYDYETSYNSDATPYGHPLSEQSGQSSTSRTEGARSWLAFSNGWTTGNTTERSSIYSLGEDEFDRKASRRVRQLFEQIDHMLFEDNPGPTHLYQECEQWVSRFPHLRILGDQLLQPQDMGFQLVSGSPRNSNGVDGLLSDITDQDITAAHGLNELSVMGQHVDARVPPVDSLAHLSETDTFQGYEKEEVFAQDGHIEDIIAVDYKTGDEDNSDKARQQRNLIRRRQSGMPPMTPQACVKDNISSTTFDIIWTEVISWLRDVLKRYGTVIHNPFHTDHMVDIGVAISESTDGDEQRSLSLALPDMQDALRDIMPPSRETSLLNSSRLDNRVPRLPMSAASHSPEGRGLDGLLTISTKALQTRGNSLGDQMTPDDLVSGLPLAMVGIGTRPGSSTTRYVMRPGSVKPQDGRLTSARLRTAPGRGRLAPLERAKTPSNDDDRQMLQNEVLRGHRLTTLNDNRFSPTPPLSFHRNGALPPISLDQQEHGLKNIEEIETELDSKTHLTGRASSAVNDKEGRSQYKDRDRERIAMALEARPSTTHAMYRSETPFSQTHRQTTTPLGFASNRVSALSGLGKALGGSNTNVLHLDVRGSGINPHVEPGGGELDGEHIDEMIHSQWDPHRGRLIHSGVFRNFEAGPAQVPPQLRRAKQQYNMGSVR